MSDTNAKDPQILAAAHADWLFGLLADTTNTPPDELAKHRRFYETAFVHGYKHGTEDRGELCAPAASEPRLGPPE